MNQPRWGLLFIVVLLALTFTTCRWMGSQYDGPHFEQAPYDAPVAPRLR